MRRSLKVSCWMAALLCVIPAFADRTEKSQHVESYLGDVVIRTDGVRIVVLVDTILDDSAATDGVVDQWFVLETPEPVLTPVSAHLPRALLVHSPRGLRITSPGNRYELMLEDEPAETDNGRLPATRVAGIGLAHNTAVTDLRVSDQLDRRGRVKPTCEACEPLIQDPGAGGGTGGAGCPSGGPGSTSCSATHGTNSCSVSCASGYYACCQAVPGAAYCRCIKG